MGLVNDDQVVALGVADLVQASVGDDADVVEVEKIARGLPVFLQGGRDDDQRVGAVIGEAVLEEELPGDQGGDDGFPEADDIGEEETVVLLEQADTLSDGIYLIAQALEAFGQVFAGVRVVVDGFAEILGEQLIVELVGRDLDAEIGLGGDFLDVLRQDIDGFFP